MPADKATADFPSSQSVQAVQAIQVPLLRHIECDSERMEWRHGKRMKDEDCECARESERALEQVMCVYVAALLSVKQQKFVKLLLLLVFMFSGWSMGLKTLCCIVYCE